MKSIKPSLVLIFMISNHALAQTIESIEICDTAPMEVEMDRRCYISTREHHLVIRIEKANEKSAVMQSIYDTMAFHSLVELDDNVYWIPDGRTCYFSWYGIDTENLLFVPSRPLVARESLQVCGQSEKSYYSSVAINYRPVSFAFVILQELERNRLLDSVSIGFTDIREDTTFYEEILQNGGTPYLFEGDTGELVSIEMQY